MADKTPPPDIDRLIGYVGQILFTSFPEDADRGANFASRFASLQDEEAKSMPTTDESKKKESGK